MPRTASNHKRKPVTLAVVSDDSLFHRIHALLHTVRVIAQHEDELCTLLHASRDSDGTDQELNAEVLALLDAMPAHDYEDDMEALRAALPAGASPRTSTPGRRNTRTASKAAAPATPVKKASTAGSLAKAAANKSSSRKSIASKMKRVAETTTAAKNSSRTRTSQKQAAAGKPVRSQRASRQASPSAGKSGAGRQRKA